MVETRPVDVQELRTLDIFASEYITREYYQVEREGAGADVSWRLSRAEAQPALARRLDRGGLAALTNLYGPADQMRFIAAFEARALTGLLTWKHEEWNNVTWVLDIRVAASHRGRGIGSRLIEDLSWAALRLDARGIMLETQNMNAPAIDFYLARGFTLVGINTHFYTGGDELPGEVALFFYLGLGE